MIELPQKKLLTPKEVADFFTVSLSTVYRWYDEGIIEGVRPGQGALRIFRTSVAALIKPSGDAA